MIEYIYFVKCPNCEDEPFSFFDEAQHYALGCLSSKPIITQVEVDRDDFGCCTDSRDLGTVWSYDNIMDSDLSVTEPAEPMMFSKSETFDLSDDELFSEFDDEEFTIEDDDDIEISIEDDEDDDDDEDIVITIEDDENTSIDIKSLVEMMEENEDTVECKWCEDLFDKSECRYELNLGWLCSRCQAAIMSRGETLTFKENNYWDFLDDDHESEDTELEEAYHYPRLNAIPNSKEQILDKLAEIPELQRYVQEGKILSTPIKLIGRNMSQDDVVDFEVVRDQIMVKIDRRNGHFNDIELETLLRGGFFNRGIQRNCPAYTLLRAIDRAAREVNNGIGVAAARNAAVAAALTPEIANEFQQHITNIQYIIPLQEYDIGDFPSDEEGFDIYAEKAVANLQQLRDNFLDWKFADEVNVTDRLVHKPDGSLVDKMYAYASQWKPKGEITFDCRISELTTEAQNVIRASKVTGNFENVKQRTTIDCVRLATALIEFFDDAKFYEAAPQPLAYTVVNNEEEILNQDEGELLTV